MRSLRTDVDDAQDSTGLVLWQVTNAWQAAQRAALKPFDLTHVQFVLLASLAWLDDARDGGAGPTTQRALADHARTDVMMTSQVLRSLEAKGLVQRHPHPRDARARALRVTASGLELVNRANAAVEGVDRTYFASLGDQRDAFTRMLRTLANAGWPTLPPVPTAPSRRELIDPESRAPLEQLLAAMPGGFGAVPEIGARREAARAARAASPVPANPNVTITDHGVPGPPGAPDLSVRVYRPKDVPGPLPGIYYVHGGGMILGDVAGDDPIASMLAEQVGAVVVSVEYRLAPEHPHPAPSEDCYAALVWTAAHADELGIDAARLAVAGGSAGGGLAIATALLARDRGGPPIAFLMPLYPMIDDTSTTPSSHEITDIGIWDRDGNIEAWAWYLGGREADGYAAPARAQDLSGLPPTFIDVGTLDLFRDEDLTFAQRLLQAGVPCELHVYPGAYHASEIFAPEAALSVRIWATRLAALRRALG